MVLRRHGSLLISVTGLSGPHSTIYWLSTYSCNIVEYDKACISKESQNVVKKILNINSAEMLVRKCVLYQ